MERLNTFANIPIQVIDSQPSTGAILAKTLLSEIHSMLLNLLETGKTSRLDLRALPSLGSEGYEFLKYQLGLGEIKASIESFGRSDVYETAYSGIWFIDHFNQDDELYTEQIEVSFLPEILKSHFDDVRLSATKLGHCLEELGEAN